jgi:hypothetical protein
MLADEFPVCGRKAAEVLRPGPVGRAVHDDMPDLHRSQLLGIRKGYASILPSARSFFASAGGRATKLTSLPRVEAHVLDHASQENVLSQPELG